MQGQYDKSIEFARLFGGGKLPPFIVIGLDFKEIDTVQFTSDEEAVNWLIRKNQSERCNIYFQVNTLLRGVKNIKKASRADIQQMDYLHVDIDARVGETLDDELERIRQLVAGFSPIPTFTVFSGNGYHLYWRLQQPFMINGQEDLYELAKRYNIHLESVLGGDGCHNVDRIMRLPGTINWPGKTKVRKGRVPVLAYMEKYNDVSYSLEQFIAAPKVQSAEKQFHSATLSISSNTVRLGSVDELDRYKVNDFIKQLIVQGRENIKNVYPEKEFASDSEAVWAVVCELERCQVPPDVMFSVLTDPDFLITAHIFRQPRPEAYATRQIERAKLYAEDPQLAEMNESHAVVANYQGKCLVMGWTATSREKRNVLTFQSFEAFRNRYMNRSVPVGMNQSKPLGQFWLQHPKRRQYEGVIFDPGGEIPGYYNMWQGFSVEARPGDWSLLKDHIFENVCCSNEELFDYILGWMARGVQFPAEPGHTSIVMRGGQGTGKSFLAKAYGHLFGEHFLAISDAKHLVGQFNGHLMNVVFLFGDEAFSAGDKQHEGRLKTLITEETNVVEDKGFRAASMNNYLHIMLASNESWVVPAGIDDRRFLVVDVSPARQQDSRYFSAIQEQLDNGGYNAMLHELLSRDISDFNVRKVPSTRAKIEQTLFSMSTLDEWWYSKLCTGQILRGHQWTDRHPIDSLLYDVDRGAMGSVQFGLYIHRAVPDIRRWKESREVTITLRDGRREMSRLHYCYEFPPLDKCREEWNRQHPTLPVEPQKWEESHATEEDHY